MEFCRTGAAAELEQIIQLQRENLAANLAEAEVAAQGFVTVRHDRDLLAAMHRRYPHIIAKDKGRVVGYALVMAPEFRNQVPALVSLFEQLSTLSFQGKPLTEHPFFVMGQICVSKSYRGSGVFGGMYQFMKEELSPDFDLVVTSIAKRNTRSSRAHEKVGFQIVREFESETGEVWEIVLWDWNNS